MCCSNLENQHEAMFHDEYSDHLVSGRATFARGGEGAVLEITFLQRRDQCALRNPQA